MSSLDFASLVITKPLSSLGETPDPMTEPARVRDDAEWDRISQQTVSRGATSTPRWKRALDRVGAGVALVLIAPLLVILSIAIKIESRGPVFFRQTRVGKDGRPFEMLKLRSMYQDAERKRAELESRNEMEGGVLFKLQHLGRSPGGDQHGGRHTCQKSFHLIVLVVSPSGRRRRRRNQKKVARSGPMRVRMDRFERLCSCAQCWDVGGGAVAPVALTVALRPVMARWKMVNACKFLRGRKNPCCRCTKNGQGCAAMSKTRPSKKRFSDRNSRPVSEAAAV